MMVMVKEKTVEQLVIHKDDLNRVIIFYESKENLADHELEGLKKLKEVKKRAITDWLYILGFNWSINFKLNQKKNDD